MLTPEAQWARGPGVSHVVLCDFTSVYTEAVCYFVNTVLFLYALLCSMNTLKSIHV